MVTAVHGLFYTELEILSALFKPVIWRSQTLQPSCVGTLQSPDSRFLVDYREVILHHVLQSGSRLKKDRHDI
jgi:hypothetical protein